MEFPAQLIPSRYTLRSLFNSRECFHTPCELGRGQGEVPLTAWLLFLLLTHRCGAQSSPRFPSLYKHYASRPLPHLPQVGPCVVIRSPWSGYGVATVPSIYASYCTCSSAPPLPERTRTRCQVGTLYCWLKRTTGLCLDHMDVWPVGRDPGLVAKTLP